MTLYIVTGSIGPYFYPLLFTTEQKAKKYMAFICRYNHNEKIFPSLAPVIEQRDKGDMISAIFQQNQLYKKAQSSYNPFLYCDYIERIR